MARLNLVRQVIVAMSQNHYESIAVLLAVCARMPGVYVCMYVCMRT
jgi:hypothetical protein